MIATSPKRAAATSVSGHGRLLKVLDFRCAASDACFTCNAPAEQGNGRLKSVSLGSSASPRSKSGCSGFGATNDQSEFDFLRKTAPRCRPTEPKACHRMAQCLLDTVAKALTGLLGRCQDLKVSGQRLETLHARRKLREHCQLCCAQQTQRSNNCFPSKQQDPVLYTVFKRPCWKLNRLMRTTQVNSRDQCHCSEGV